MKRSSVAAFAVPLFLISGLLARYSIAAAAVTLVLALWLFFLAFRSARDR